MSKRSNGKERGGQRKFPSTSPTSYSFLLSKCVFLSLLPFHPPFTLLSNSFSPSFSPLLLVPSFSLTSPFSTPPSLLTSFPACVRMCNVLKLARSTADCCRYRLINYKSCLSDQLPHRGQTDPKTDMRGG